MTTLTISTATPVPTTAASTRAGDSDVHALLAAIAILAAEGLIASDVTPHFYHLPQPS